MFFKSGCIDKIYSVSAVIGGKRCNARCPGCAGRSLHKDIVEDIDNHIAPRNIVAASRLALNYGAWTLSLTSGGEPTLYSSAITDTLEELDLKRVHWPFINLFTNGIRIQNEPDKMVRLLNTWKDLGLTSVVLSIHSTNLGENAKVYGTYLNYPEIIKTIKSTGLCVKIVLLLSRFNVCDVEEYKKSLDVIKSWGVNMVTSWEIRNNDGTKMENWTPSFWEMLKIRAWLLMKTKPCMGHAWGGVVRSYNGMNIRLTDYVSEHKASNDFIRQLVLLSGGKVSYSWHQDGMFCLD